MRGQEELAKLGDPSSSFQNIHAQTGGQQVVVSDALAGVELAPGYDLRLRSWSVGEPNNS
jgi:hypothetical protein